ncbi:hypothetical protein ACQCVP_09035 [Rossellomorea vietnamensis]
MGLFDPEGLGAGSRLGVSPVPLVPQEIVHLPLQPFYVKGEMDKIAFKAIIY